MAALLIDTVIYYFLLPETLDINPAIHMVRWGCMVLGAFVLIFVIPFIKKGSDSSRFWTFMWELVSRLFVTVLFSLAIWGGLSLALASLDFLFGINIDGDWFFRIWVTVAGIFAPWFFLAGFPKEFDVVTKSKDYPKYLRILVMYIGVPIVSIYMLIMYAYSIKILLPNNWLQGDVVWLMIAFLVAGLAVTLLMYPLDEKGAHPIYKRLQKGFFISALPLMIVYFLAINIRIQDYGWTDPRYLVVVFGVWMVASCLSYLFLKRDIRWVFGWFVILAWVIVWLPGIGMFDTGIRSQSQRFEAFLNEHGLVSSDGTIAASNTQITSDRSAYSIIQYLHNHDALTPFLDRFKTPIDTEKYSQWELADEVLKSLNVDMVYGDSRYERIGVRVLQINTHNQEHDIAGYDRMLRFDSWQCDDDREVCALEKGLNLQINIGEATETIDMRKVARALLESEAQPTIYEDVLSDGLPYRLIFEYAHGEFKDATEEWENLSYNGWILLVQE